MGNIISAIEDDADDWQDFKHKANIRGVNWDQYSIEATIAEELYSNRKYTGPILILATKQAVALNALKAQQTAELTKLEESLRILTNLGFEISCKTSS